jgi:hypothetical protein
MNPIMIDGLYRAESGERARQLAEIRMINQAYPRERKSSGGQVGLVRTSLGGALKVGHQVRAWLAALSERGMDSADSTQPSR